MKIKEKDLEKEVVRFNEKNVILKIDSTVSINLRIKNLKIKYVYKTGFLHIKDETRKIHFKVNVIPANYIDVTENSLLIKLDNYIDIYLKVKE